MGTHGDMFIGCYILLSVMLVLYTIGVLLFWDNSTNMVPGTNGILVVVSICLNECVWKWMKKNNLDTDFVTIGTCVKIGGCLSCFIPALIVLSTIESQFALVAVSLSSFVLVCTTHLDLFWTCLSPCGEYTALVASYVLIAVFSVGLLYNGVSPYDIIYLYCVVIGLQIYPYVHRQSTETCSIINMYCRYLAASCNASVFVASMVVFLLPSSVYALSVVVVYGGNVIYGAILVISNSEGDRLPVTSAPIAISKASIHEIVDLQVVQV